VRPHDHVQVGGDGDEEFVARLGQRTGLVAGEAPSPAAPSAIPARSSAAIATGMRRSPARRTPIGATLALGPEVCG